MLLHRSGCCSRPVLFRDIKKGVTSNLGRQARLEMLEMDEPFSLVVCKGVSNRVCVLERLGFDLDLQEDLLACLFGRPLNVVSRR